NAHLYQASVVANETKDTFLATMSHELRTPLTAIIGYGQLLAEGVVGALTDRQRQQLDRITVNAQQLLTLIQDILLHARLDAGRAVVHLDEIEAQLAVHDAIEVVPATNGHLTLPTEIADPTRAVRSERENLRGDVG